MRVLLTLLMLVVLSSNSIAQSRLKVMSVPDTAVSLTSALTDLRIEDGPACGANNGVQRILRNTNTAQRVVATVVTTSAVNFDYRRADRTASTYTYPHSRIENLNPGDFRVVGCTKWNVRSQIVSQDFYVSGAYYPSGDITFPPSTENAMDFAQIYVVRWPDCDAEGQLGTLEFLGDSHPFRTIVVDYANVQGGSGGGSNAVLTPQGRALTVGCSGLNEGSFEYRITRATFAP